MNEQSTPAQGPTPEQEGVRSEDRVSVRRSPKYPRFIVLGAGVGAVVTYIVTALYPVDPAVGFGALFGYFVLFGVPIGAALGGLLAIVLDVVGTRRARQLTAERTSVEAREVPLDGDLED